VTEPTTKEPAKKPFLYVVVCACGIAGDVGKLITAAQTGAGGAASVGLVAAQVVRAGAGPARTAPPDPQAGRHWDRQGSVASLPRCGQPEKLGQRTSTQSPVAVTGGVVEVPSNL
jgi:hypothetical protein